MAYSVYLDKILCPVTPSKMQLKIKNQNKSIVLINEGEVNILKVAGLTEISFDLMVPNVTYPFARYDSGFQNAKYFLDAFEKLKTSKKPFQFIVVREMPNGKGLFNTNITVAMEDYQIKEDCKEGFDVILTIKLKQYKSYGVKTCDIKIEGQKAQVKQEPKRETANSPAPTSNQTYTVVKGDCLWNIAKKFYGNGSKYTVIANANKDKIKNPNLIYPGQVLTIPPA